MAILLGVDVGTTGIKALAARPDGTIAAESFTGYDISSPHPKWAEQNPDDWWNAFCSTMRELFHGEVEPEDIASLGLSGQMHTSVFLDEGKRVIRPAILWCDVRTTAQCTTINERVGFDTLRDEASNPALEGFTAPKVLWLREEEPHNFKRLRHLLIAKDYIRYRLTGKYATEVSDASGMNLLDVPNRCWSKQVLAALEIDEELLAPVYESPDVTGVITAEAAALTGLRAGTPVVGGAGDNAAAAVGTGVVKAGRAFTTIGTSGVVFAHSDQVTIDPAGRVHTFCHSVPGSGN